MFSGLIFIYLSKKNYAVPLQDFDKACSLYDAAFSYCTMFKTLLLTYKARNNSCPGYLKYCLDLLDHTEHLRRTYYQRMPHGPFDSDSETDLFSCHPALWNALSTVSRMLLPLIVLHIFYSPRLSVTTEFCNQSWTLH